MRRLLEARLQREKAPEDRCSALVLAPHQDDETLGCGGTIIRKRNAGTPVNVAFMTDGTTSHKRFLNSTKLAERRRAEAVSACHVLGLEDKEIHFLQFPDGKLDMFHDEAVGTVTTLLASLRPEEIYIPYQYDGTSDHEATYRIVRNAIWRLGMGVRVFEYPIWAWNCWPWVSIELSANRTGINALRTSSLTWLGFNSLRAFRSGTCSKDVLVKKRLALDEHKTQMVRQEPGDAWPILRDVSGGQFLDCFFQDHEVFRRSTISARQHILRNLSDEYGEFRFWSRKSASMIRGTV